MNIVPHPDDPGLSTVHWHEDRDIDVVCVLVVGQGLGTDDRT